MLKNKVETKNATLEKSDPITSIKFPVTDGIYCVRVLFPKLTGTALFTLSTICGKWLINRAVSVTNGGIIHDIINPRTIKKERKTRKTATPRGIPLAIRASTGCFVTLITI